MPTIETEVQIDASPEEVWAVLMDFRDYAEWNPFIQYNGGLAQPGERLDLRLKLPTGQSFSIMPIVTERVENERFEWIGKMIVSGIFDGRHTFEIEERDGGTLFKQYEQFRGLLAFPLGWVGVYKKTRAGFELMNEALKKTVEESFAPSGT